MAQNPIVSSLPAYVDENKIGLLSKAVLGATSIRNMNLQTGIKDAATVNVADYAVKFGDGKTCGWDPNGTVTLSQRKIQTGQIKVQLPFCDKKMLGTYAQYQVKVAAGQKTLPFEQDFVEGLNANIGANLEVAIWKGDTGSEDENLNKFDGLIKIIDAAPGVIDSQLAGGETKYEVMKKINAKLPTAVRNAGAVIYVGSDVFADFIQEMVDANLYHYDATNDGMSYTLPGFKTKVVSTPGLDGTNRVFAGLADNFFYGCDMAGDEEKYELWYSQDAREFRYNVEFNAGTQVAFPDQIVKGTIA